jgi:hypothetical protein
VADTAVGEPGTVNDEELGVADTRLLAMLLSIALTAFIVIG